MTLRDTDFPNFLCESLHEESSGNRRHVTSRVTGQAPDPPTESGETTPCPCPCSTCHTSNVAPVVLDPASVAAIALAVVELLQDDLPSEGGLVDAATLARILGLSRDAVYRRAAELGGVRVGPGSRGRLRFDVETARAALTPCSGNERSEPPDSAVARRSGRRSRARTGTTAPLLPIGAAEARREREEDGTDAAE